MINSLRFRYATLLAIGVMASMHLSSCGMGVWMSSLFGGQINLRAVVAPKSNQDNPVQVDVLLVYDEPLLKQLVQVTAKDWFEKRDEIVKNFPPGEGLDTWSWEWIPAQAVPMQRLPLRSKAVGGIVFANYQTPGPHRSRFNPHADLVISLQEKTFTLEQPE